MTRVTLFGTDESRYQSLYLAGLAELEAAGEISLGFEACDSLPLAPNAGHASFWLNIENPNSHLVFFDLRDSAKGFVEPALTLCNSYFKRSLITAETLKLPLELREKILPMPLNYPVSSPLVNTKLRLRRSHATRRWGRRSASSIRRTLLAISRRSSIAHRFGVRRPPPFVDYLRGSPTDQVEPVVYFRTRLYDPAAAQSARARVECERLNDSRIQLIRELRSAFGDQAFCGLYEAPGSKSVAPELIQPLPAGYQDSDGHLRYSARCLINVNNVGVGGSNGWKIAEILRSGRCLVSETLEHEIAPPLSDGEHYRSFADPKSCVDACSALLNDPVLASAQRIAGTDYFEAHLRPEKVMRYLLHEATSQAL